MIFKICLFISIFFIIRELIIEILSGKIIKEIKKEKRF